jgi:spore coat polysaccharide biosynthesis protein SpsF
MTSSRLPGKTLMPLAGKPMLQHLLDRLLTAFPRERLLVLTSNETSDDPIAEYCATQRLPCFRGSLLDVAGRFLAAADQLGAPAFVRLSGDSPFLDVALIHQALALYAQHRQPDLVTNVLTRTFPKGQSVELMNTAALRRAYARYEQPGDYEHVGPYFYRHPDQFRIVDFTASPARGQVSLVIDTREEFAAAEALLAAMDRPAVQYTWQETLALRDRLAGGSATP